MEKQETIDTLEVIIRTITGSAYGTIELLAIEYAKKKPEDKVGILNLNNYVRKEAEGIDTTDTLKFLHTYFKEKLHNAG